MFDNFILFYSILTTFLRLEKKSLNDYQYSTNKKKKKKKSLTLEFTLEGRDSFFTVAFFLPFYVCHDLLPGECICVGVHIPINFELHLRNYSGIFGISKKQINKEQKTHFIFKVLLDFFIIKILKFESKFFFLLWGRWETY